MMRPVGAAVELQSALAEGLKLRVVDAEHAFIDALQVHVVPCVERRGGEAQRREGIREEVRKRVLHPKAPEDWRTPRRCRESIALASKSARSWTAVVLYRF